MLPLLTPWFIHRALDAAGSAELLGIDPAQVYALSDRSVEELVFGPGSFTFDGPDGEAFYDTDERGHLGDARLLLGLCLVAGGVSLVLIATAIGRAAGARRVALWRAVSRAGLTSAAAVVILGVISLVAFGTLFDIFHRVFFPAGNYSFDPATQHLVQLYPFRFWQVVAAALGTLVVLLGLGAWLLGRREARRAGSATRAQEV